jgi:hypothetical protein
MKRLLLFLMIAGVYVLHQDNWNWKNADPLIFGCLPPGLAFHAAFSVLASIMMWILVKAAWPTHLEVEEKELKPGQSKQEGGH